MPMDLDAFKERTRAAWSLGDYDRIAPLLLPAAQELVDACAISAGQEVLDVAAGNGNLAVLAAREGAAVVASDITPALVEKGRARTDAEGLDVEWVEADAEALPFEDGRFDCAASVFGAIFAPRPEVAASELFRVVRPGNTVGLTAWTPESLPGRLFAISAKYLPPPEGLRPASEWGVEDIVRERFGRLAGTLETERQSVRWEFASEDDLTGALEGSCGPQLAVAEAIGPEREAERREERAALVREFNQATDGSVALDCEYLLVVARKRG